MVAKNFWKNSRETSKSDKLDFRVNRAGLISEQYVIDAHWVENKFCCQILKAIKVVWTYICTTTDLIYLIKQKSISGIQTIKNKLIWPIKHNPKSFRANKASEQKKENIHRRNRALLHLR